MTQGPHQGRSQPALPGGSELAHAYAVRLLQHLVVPTFVIDPQRRVVVWNRACERLTGVARQRKDDSAPVPEKREPEFAAPKPMPMMPKPVETLPKGLKIERPDDDNLVTGMPKRIEAQPKVVSIETREPVDESPADDDLEIPAFLRRRAK